MAQDLAKSAGVHGNLVRPRLPSPPVAAVTPRQATRSVARTGLRQVVLVGVTLGLVVTVLLGVSLVGAVTDARQRGLQRQVGGLVAEPPRLRHGQPDRAVVLHRPTRPSKGGRPKSLNPVPSARAARSVGSTDHPRRAPPPARCPRPSRCWCSPALAGEGVWRPTGPLVDGAPHMFVAQFRADAVYTSQITSAVWIDPTAFSLALDPGCPGAGRHLGPTSQPGRAARWPGPWPPSTVASGSRTPVVGST